MLTLEVVLIDIEGIN